MRVGTVVRTASVILVIAGFVLTAVSLTQIKSMGVNFKIEEFPELIPYTEQTATNLEAKLYPRKGTWLGVITIPTLNTILPIYEGTEDSQLKKGVGHYIGSVLPGVQDNSVLAGHRDSVFRHLGKLHIGDKIIVETRSGIFTYKVARTRIVMADDRTVIVPTKTAVLTLSTCYPFRYIGNAPKRYIVSADLQTPVL